MTLLQLRARAAGGERLVAHLAGELLEDEAIEDRVVGRRIEAKRALGTLQADLDGAGLLLCEVGIADLERLGRFVHAFGEQLAGIRRALDVLRREASDDAHGQLVRAHQRWRFTGV